MSDENNGLVEPELEPVHLVLELGAGHGVQGGEGLIHEDDLRVGGKGAGYADALPLAAGELGGYWLRYWSGSRLTSSSSSVIRS